MSFTTRPELRGTFGMVASTHWLASAAGMAVLERGGNAFDAAVAAGFTLQVVEPHLNGPGGDLPAVFWPAPRGEPLVLCAQGVAPRGGDDRALPRRLGLELVPGTGPARRVRPGRLRRLARDAARATGRCGSRDVLEFAIGYAEHGYPVVAASRRSDSQRRAALSQEWTTSADVYLPVPEPGALARNPALAATYRRVVDGGRSRRDRPGRADRRGA